MRIVYVFTSLGIGGAERQGLAIAERMAARGHTVSLLILRPRLQQEWPTKLEVLHLNLRKTPTSFIASLRQAVRHLQSVKPDLLHSHSFHANFFARLLKLFIPSVAVISTVHNIYEGGRLRMLAYRMTDRLSLRTIAVSQAAADNFIQLKAGPRNKCVVIANAIDTAEFSTDPARRTATRESMSAGTDFIWLAVGRVAPAKDYPNLLRAFDEVRAHLPESQLWIAGEPSAGSSQIIGADPGENGVRWLGLRRDVPALLDASDAFVLSSAWEGMPLVVGEAMAMEKPVVATDVGGVRELLGDCGSLVPAQSSHALAAAMLQLMRTPAETRTAIGQAARSRIQSLFNMDSKTGEWELFYHSLLNHAS
jgi:glycosyltransferase involved in cell wall biosynthesis